jgi:hypothetical protein
MRESDPARKSTFDLLLGERTVGRPKRRWTEEVEIELKGMGVKDWKKVGVGKGRMEEDYGGDKGLNWAVEPRRRSCYFFYAVSV